MAVKFAMLPDREVTEVDDLANWHSSPLQTRPLPCLRNLSAPSSGAELPSLWGSSGPSVERSASDFEALFNQRCSCTCSVSGDFHFCAEADDNERAMSLVGSIPRLQATLDKIGLDIAISVCAVSNDKGQVWKSTSLDDSMPRMQMKLNKASLNIAISARVEHVDREQALSSVGSMPRQQADDVEDQTFRYHLDNG